MGAAGDTDTAMARPLLSGRTDSPASRLALAAEGEAAWQEAGEQVEVACMSQSDQIKKKIVEMVAAAKDQRLRPAEMIRSLATDFGVSMMRVRQALGDLISERRLVFTYRSPCTYVEIPCQEWPPGVRPLKVVTDSKGQSWICDYSVDPARDLAEQGCWRMRETVRQGTDPRKGRPIEGYSARGGGLPHRTLPAGDSMEDGGDFSGENLVKVHTVENRFEADFLVQALRQEQIPVLLRCFEETAYDGLFVPRLGWGALLVPHSREQAARRLIKRLLTTTKFSGPKRSHPPAEQ